MRRNRSRRAGTGCVVASVVMIAVVVGPSPVRATPSGSMRDDEVAVELLDEAADALVDGDLDTHRRVIERMAREDIWIPDLAEQALREGDIRYLVEFSDLLASDDTGVVEIARDSLDWEREMIAEIEPGSTGSPDQRLAIEEADIEGIAMLDMIDHRGIEVPMEVRTLLEVLPSSGPGPLVADYDVALDLVDASIDESSAGDDGGGRWVSRVAVVVVALLGSAALAAGWITMVRSRRGSERLSDIAFTDGLTGLNNRRRLDDDLVSRSELGALSSAMLMIDVDHFKHINDNHGHQVGDEVLRRIGQILNEEFRATDVPYRYGGEEFCVIMDGVTCDQALVAAERLRVAIENLAVPGVGPVTASIGISTGPASEPTRTLADADTALYAAKQAGRNRVVLAAG